MDGRDEWRREEERNGNGSVKDGERRKEVGRG